MAGAVGGVSFRRIRAPDQLVIPVPEADRLEATSGLLCSGESRTDHRDLTASSSTGLKPQRHNLHYRTMGRDDLIAIICRRKLKRFNFRISITMYISILL